MATAAEIYYRDLVSMQHTSCKQGKKKRDESQHLTNVGKKTQYSIEQIFF